MCVFIIHATLFGYIDTAGNKAKVKGLLSANKGIQIQLQNKLLATIPLHEFEKLLLLSH